MLCICYESLRPCSAFVGGYVTCSKLACVDFWGTLVLKIHQ